MGVSTSKPLNLEATEEARPVGSSCFVSKKDHIALKLREGPVQVGQPEDAASKKAAAKKKPDSKDLQLT